MEPDRVKYWSGQVAEQRRWITECGGDLAGYVSRYGDPLMDRCFGDGGSAIFKADLAELARREERLAHAKGQRERSLSTKLPMVAGTLDLKLMLMTLGNRLTQERGFTPGPQPMQTVGRRSVTLFDANERRTSIITLLTQFINIHKDAQDILKELGVTWPVVQGQSRDSE